MRTEDIGIYNVINRLHRPPTAACTVYVGDNAIAAGVKCDSQKRSGGGGGDTIPVKIRNKRFCTPLQACIVIARFLSLALTLSLSLHMVVLV